MDYHLFYLVRHLIALLIGMPVFMGMPSNGAVIPSKANAKLPSHGALLSNCSAANKNTQSHIDVTAIEMLKSQNKVKENHKLAGPAGYKSKSSQLKNAPKNCTGNSYKQPPSEHSRGSEVTITQNDDTGKSWKTKIIISCTIAASIEVVIVVLIVLYWKEIRWTLRKLTCPILNQRQRSGSHEVMPENAAEGDHYGNQEDTEAETNGYSVRLYSPVSIQPAATEIEEHTV